MFAARDLKSCHINELWETVQIKSFANFKCLYIREMVPLTRASGDYYGQTHNRLLHIIYFWSPCSEISNSGRPLTFFHSFWDNLYGGRKTLEPDWTDISIIIGHWKKINIQSIKYTNTELNDWPKVVPGPAVIVITAWWQNLSE